MSDPPAYPPPPDQPPAGYPPPPSEPPREWPPAAYPPTQPPPPDYPAAADYASPAYGYPPPPVRQRVSRNLGVLIAAVIVVVVLLVGIIGYVFAGYAYASSRISDAAGAINTTTAHRSYVNTTFDLLDQQVTSLNAMTDDAMAKSTSGQLVTESQAMSTTIGGDDQPLAAARVRLHDQGWLTATSSGRLDGEISRIDHARNAVATVKSAAGDYVLFGQFLQTYYQALIDADTLIADANNNDYVGATGADSMFQADVAKALQASNSPGLPQEFHDYLVVLQAYAVDTGAELNALGSGNKAAFDAAHKLIVAEIAKLNAIDFSGSTAKIKSYYQRYRVDFNSELDKATA